MSEKPCVLVFASGSATGGGSGFAKMVEQTKGAHPVLNATIVGVVSNHSAGGVAEKAHALGIRFFHWPGPFDADGYRSLKQKSGAEWCMLSGWLKRVTGLDPATVVNIHPGPLPLTRGMHGDQVHQTVLDAYRAGEIERSAVNMHFIDDRDGKYDTGSVAFSESVEILRDDTLEILRARVNACEHAWQSFIFNLIIRRDIQLLGDGLKIHPEAERAIRSRRVHLKRVRKQTLFSLL